MSELRKSERLTFTAFFFLLIVDAVRCMKPADQIRWMHTRPDPELGTRKRPEVPVDTGKVAELRNFRFFTVEAWLLLTLLSAAWSSTCPSPLSHKCKRRLIHNGCAHIVLNKTLKQLFVLPKPGKIRA
jgi:hypothetical protein